MIPFKVKLLTDTAKAPEMANEADLWDLFADDFLSPEDLNSTEETIALVLPVGNRVLVKTGISLELPKQIKNNGGTYGAREFWVFGDLEAYTKYPNESLLAYAVADLRPRSGLALKHGITVLNAPATIDNSYRKEIGVILYNAGHEPYTIKKGDKICQMLIRPLYPSKMEIVDNVEDSGRGVYCSTGK